MLYDVSMLQSATFGLQLGELCLLLWNLLVCHFSRECSTSKEHKPPRAHLRKKWTLRRHFIGRTAVHSVMASDVSTNLSLLVRCYRSKAQLGFLFQRHSQQSEGWCRGHNLCSLLQGNEQEKRGVLSTLCTNYSHQILGNMHGYSDMRRFHESSIIR